MTEEQAYNLVEYDFTKGECEKDLLTTYNQYFPMVLRLCRKYYFALYDKEDLHQEALLVCFTSIKTFDEQYNVPFGAFYKNNLERHFCTLLRQEKSAKRIINEMTVPYDETTAANDHKITELSNLRYNAESIYLSKMELTTTISRLDDFEKKILYFHLFSRKTPKEIAKHLNIKTSKVYEILSTIKTLLKSRLSLK